MNTEVNNESRGFPYVRHYRRRLPHLFSELLWVRVLRLLVRTVSLFILRHPTLFSLYYIRDMRKTSCSFKAEDVF